MPRRINPRTIDVPIDVDPRTVQGDHTALSVPRAAFDRLHKGWLTLQDAAKRVQDSDKLAKEAKAHVDRLVRAAKADNENIWAGYRHLDAKIDATLAPNPSDPMGGEIRRYLSGQKHPVAAAMEAVTTGDRRIVAAILNAPPQLSGLTREQRDNIRSHAARTFEPEEHAAMEELSKQGIRHGEYMERFEKMARQKISLWETGDDDAIAEIFADAG